MREYNAGETIMYKVIKVLKTITAWLVYWALIVFYAWRSPALSWKDKSKLVAALLLLAIPIGLLIDAIPVAGVIDDVVILLAWAIVVAKYTTEAVFLLLEIIDENIKAQAAEKVCQWFGKFCLAYGFIQMKKKKRLLQVGLAIVICFLFFICLIRWDGVLDWPILY